MNYMLIGLVLWAIISAANLALDIYLHFFRAPRP